MASFYNQSTAGGAVGGPAGGFYNAGNYGDQYQQAQQDPTAQSTGNNYQQQMNFGNVQQWQAPSAATSQNQTYSHNLQGGQQQPQTQSQTHNFWNPSTMAMAGLAAQAVSGGITSSQALDQVINIVPVPPNWKASSVVPGFDSTMTMLRTYFAVDNRYVQRKMKKVLFPFVAKQWRRLHVEGPEMINYALPNSDENAPDLYLPVMSLITYCLLCALTYGTSGQFNPEVIPDVTTKCFVTQVLEVLLIRFGFYMMETSVPFLDLFSYTGYKYLGLTINMLCGLLLGHLGYGTSGFYVTFLWTASAATFFMLKTMANNIPTETAAAGPKREIMVLVFAISQAVSMWFVSQTKFL